MSSKRSSEDRNISIEEHQSLLGAGIMEDPSVHSCTSTPGFVSPDEHMERGLCGNGTQTTGWLADGTKQLMDTTTPGQRGTEDDDLDCDMTYGEVEHKLDQLQQHLSRLESQMTSDIQSILQLLQRQTCLGPPAYSSLTDYKRPAIRVQPVASEPICQSPCTTSQNPDFLSMTDAHFDSKDSPSDLSLMDSNPQQSYGTLQPSQDSAPTYSLINSQTLPLTHSKSHVIVQQSSPPDMLLNSVATGTVDLHRPLSDPGLLKEQH
ncbi:Potassium voltage-gated channel subfamily H member 7 [Triplophysa tibetana]|uniref:Potassium voltage-gated channel subfamily H member 7 n=1 Tax=Triplophysa tibetana TaxID=1572043 RepID=A0A5A9P3W0_9TELE|nr:Potassium voltage-gated channel subfamily H member 7 [Triplophysa tibetana]